MLDFLKPYKLIIYGVLLVTLLGMIGAGVHSYNSGLIEQGKAEVTAEWAKKTRDLEKAAETKRKALEGQKTVLAKKYHAEQAARKELQRQLDKEQEDAIKNSSVASNVCFDDGMRDSWNRSGGHPGASASGAARRGVDADVPAGPSETGR